MIAVAKKVIAFDMDLNIISSSVMACTDLNEYGIDILNKQSAFNNYTGELSEAHSNFYIDFSLNDYNEKTACYLHVI